MEERIAFRKVAGAAKLTVIETDTYSRRLSDLKAAVKFLEAQGCDDSWWITPAININGWIVLRADLEEQL